MSVTTITLTQIDEFDEMDMHFVRCVNQVCVGNARTTDEKFETKISHQSVVVERTCTILSANLTEKIK